MVLRYTEYCVSFLVTVATIWVLISTETTATKKNHKKIEME